jgi:tetratricopeptide (TPR) repeat protein
MLNPKALSIILFCLCAFTLVLPANAQDATTKPAKPKAVYIDPDAQHDQLVADLQSGDDARVEAALAGVKAYAMHYDGPRHGIGAQLRAMQILLDAKRYSDLDSIALAEIAKNPGYSKGIAAMEKIRAQAFLSAGNSASALSTAKTYYAVVPLKITADAIDLVALCLASAHPDDSAIVQRFKDQQVAWAASAPTSQPDQTPADAALGDPILAGITVDPKPFDSAVTGVVINSYAQFAAKGNLLLLAGRYAEARTVFEKAVLVAPSANAGEAYENVARAIRAQSGCVAPANAYILSIQGAK